MPEGLSIFAYFPGYHNLIEALKRYSWFRTTWMEGKDLESSGLQHVIGILTILVLCIIASIYIRIRLRDIEANIIPEKKPNLKNFLEILVEITFNITKEVIGKEAAIYFFPLIGTVTIFVLFSNLMGLLPGFIPPTGNLNTTLAAALVVFFATHIFGFKKHGLNYLKQFFGPIISWKAVPLMILMFFVEIVGHIARPVSLALRLLGNMFADHTVVTIFTLLVPLLIPVPLMFLGLIVAVVQTLIFAVLTMIYISLAISEEH